MQSGQCVTPACQTAWSGRLKFSHNLLSVLASLDLCYGDFFFKRADRSERNLGTRGFSILPNFSLHTLKAKNQNFRVLPLAPNIMHEAASVQAKQFPGRGYGCQP